MTSPAQRAEARNLARIRRISTRLAAVRRANADPNRPTFEARAADLQSQLDALLIGRCRRCHRPISDPVSIARGRGPECVGK